MAKYLDLPGLTHFKDKLDAKYASEFVRQQPGKDLSTNDFDDNYKDILDNMQGAQFDAITNQEIDGLF